MKAFKFIKDLFIRSRDKKIRVQSYSINKDSSLVGADVKLERFVLTYKADENGDIEALEIKAVYRFLNNQSMSISVPLDEHELFIKTIQQQTTNTKFQRGTKKQ